MKNAIRADSRSSYIPSNSTVGSIMKRKLKMSYHLLEKKQRKVTQEDGVRKFIQAFSLQIQLNKYETELIFIDEFSFSSQKRKFRGRAKKGSKADIVEEFNDFHMSFIVAFFSRHFY